MVNKRENKSTRKRKHLINFFDSSQTNKYYQKEFILNHADLLNDFCKSLGLKVNEIVLVPNDEDPFTSTKTKVTILPFEVPEERNIFQYLIGKDVSMLSNQNYRLQRKALLPVQKIPGIKKVLKMQHELNNFFKIENNHFGNYCNPEEKIKYVCAKFLLKNPKFANSSFKIKLNIDSTSISKKNILLLNVSFNLIDDYETAQSIDNTFILGSFEITKEEYEQIKLCLKQLLKLLENTKVIKLHNLNYNIIFYLGCDYKMIRILYGQKAPNSLDG